MSINAYPVEIDVSTSYIVQESDPSDNYYLFHYQITIYNRGDKDLTILSRRWVLVDGNGHKKEKKGTGINGEKRIIKMGESFNYKGNSNLSTPVGSLEACYLAELDTGDQIEVCIKPLGLAVPGVLH